MDALLALVVPKGGGCAVTVEGESIGGEVARARSIEAMADGARVCLRVV